MRHPKYKCPHCGNIELLFVKETVVQRSYKLREDGEPYKRQFSTVEFYSDGDDERIWCDECNADVPVCDGVELKRWENPEYKQKG